MATSALSYTNAKQRYTAAFMEGVNQNVAVQNQAQMSTFDWRYDENVAAIQSAPYTGIGALSTWNKSDTISASAIEALDPQVITYVAYVAKLNFDPFTPSEINGYRDSCVRKLGFAAASTIAEAAAAIKASAFTTNMVHGTKPLFSTTHEKASGTRSNKYSGTFDRTAYLSMRNGMVTWTGYQGQVTNLTGAGLTCEFHPDNREAAYQAIKSRVTSNQEQYNVAADDNVVMIENEYYDDADDVILETRIPDAKPFGAWQRMAPRMFTDVENGGAIECVTVVMGYVFYAKGVPDGAFGATSD